MEKEVLEKAIEESKKIHSIREQLEQDNPEMFAEINRLRELRNKCSDEAGEYQKQIDALYNKMGGFDKYEGKYLIIKESDEDTSVYMHVRTVERQYNGAKFVGETLRLFEEVNGTYKYVSFDSEDEVFVKFSNKEFTIIDADEFDEIMRKAKRLMRIY